MLDTVTVPEFITVHLGRPDQKAENVTVRFTDYIKNVASSEIYPTWPENAIRANIYAQISLALNRIYTEYYRSRGYDFDITNSTSFDQAFVNGRDYFSNISAIVDEIFDSYVAVQGSVQPYYTEYCDGRRVTCKGLSQWGSVSLANQGYTPYQILQYYYGNDIDIRRARQTASVRSYPGRPLSLGSLGENVRTLQTELNRIARNYPAIPKIPSANGVFNEQTENAVKAFQRIFNLTPDGVVGFSTWYKIRSIYSAVKRLSELYSEGVSITEAQRKFPRVLRRGSSGLNVSVIQYYLNFLGEYVDTLPTLSVDGVFGADTEDAVKAFQRYAGLKEDGIIGEATWNAVTDEYGKIVRTLPPSLQADTAYVYPGTFLTRGSTGRAVEQLQTMLRVIGRNSSLISPMEVTGTYGEQTEAAVKKIQTAYGYEPNGATGPLTWNAIVSLYNEYRSY